MTTSILIVASKYLPEYTGASFRIHNLYQKISKQHSGQGITAEVLCGGIEHNKRETYDIDNVKINRLLDLSSSEKAGIKRVLYYYIDFFRAYKFIKSNNFDVLHVIGTSAITAAAYYYSYINKKPLILELVTSGAEPVIKLPVIGKFWAPKKDEKTVIITISDLLWDKCRVHNLEHITWSRPNPINSAKFFPELSKKHVLRKKHTKFTSDDIVISMIAKFMPQKNQIFLVHILKKLNAQYKLILGGPRVLIGALSDRDVQYFKKLTALIEQYDLKDRIQIMDDFIDNPQDIIKSSDIYAMPNMDEGLGTPMLEALSCAVPVIANEAEKPFRDHIENGMTGFLVPLEVDLWVDAIEAMNTVKPENLITKSQDLIERYSLDAFSKIYMTFIKVLSDKDVGSVLKIQRLIEEEVITANG